MASNGSHFVDIWIVFKYHLLEVGLTQNQETMALRTFTLVELFYFIMWEDPARLEIHWNNIWLRARSFMASHYIWRFVTALHDIEGALGWPFDTFLGAFTIPWSWLLARVWSGPYIRSWGLHNVKPIHAKILTWVKKGGRKLWQDPKEAYWVSIVGPIQYFFLMSCVKFLA